MSHVNIIILSRLGKLGQLGFILKNQAGYSENQSILYRQENICQLLLPQNQLKRRRFNFTGLCTLPFLFDPYSLGCTH